MKKKGFASAFFAAFAVFALAFLISTILIQNSGFQNAQLESRIAKERFDDARDLANWTQEDAIVDAAFAYACNAGNFCAQYPSLLPAYWNAVKGELNDSIANASFASVPFCSQQQVNPRLLTFSVGSYGSLSASSKNTFKNATFSYNKTGSVVTLRLGRAVTVIVTILETGTSFTYNCP